MSSVVEHNAGLNKAHEIKAHNLHRIVTICSSGDDECLFGAYDTIKFVFWIIGVTQFAY